MSPSENDLRAALRDGEGDDLDVERIVHHGRERAQRRSRLLNAAAITVVVAGLGAGLTYLGRSDGSSGGGDQAGSRAQYDPMRLDASGKNARQPAAGGVSASTPRNAAGLAATDCPTSLPRYLLPPTAATDTGGSLFSGPVATAVVCAYGTAGQKAPVRVELEGADAKALAGSLNNTSVRKPAGMCPDYRTADEQSLAIIGFDANGDRVGLVTTTLGRPPCAVDVRNGKFVRYGWQPPAALTHKLAIVPGGGISHSMVQPSESPTK